eukprot:CAMPEP_0201570358 /NCGR_PEP_ID=MMETSP0190_2-20130828/12588_1 /ASSEMBLY_ACC=CAM_ASM_000263 /TAXON_ID=37353 /ORGANISM="Rosalina sp." /LENGTH=219 /DNA_ID=CAMNT_0047993823 /DNA_START=8 /DNA_END=664 /DNA_ORIENTATION=-
MAEETYGALDTNKDGDGGLINTGGPFRKSNVTTLLNERKCRLILYSGVLLSWSLPQMGIIADDIQDDQCGGFNTVKDYCEVWMTGFTITTFASLLVLVAAYWDSSPAVFNWIVAILLFCGTTIAFVGSAMSVDDICGSLADDETCEVGFLGPSIFATLTGWAIALDCVADLLKSARVRICVFATINFIQSTMICIWIFNNKDGATFFTEPVNDTIQAGW